MSKTPRFSVRSKSGRERAENVAGQSPISTTVRWPVDLHRWVTIKALDEHSSIQQLIIGWAKAARRGGNTA